jgi:phosphoribosyl 1,2-cyclic phosphodiesterase
MRFSVLSSGSKANSVLLQSSSTNILIDCGLSAKECERRMRCLNFDPASLDAILITHEHRDHVFGVPVLSRRYKIPVYANAKTGSRMPAVYGLENFDAGSTFELGSMSIHSFRIVHDAIDPVGFRIQADGETYAQATDLGQVTPGVRVALRGAHSILLESNHDSDLLWSCDYPWELKQRISSSHGHLSNNVASELLFELCHGDLKHVILGHISENSNRPELALATARKASEHVNLNTLVCANPYEQTSFFEVAA